MRLWFGRVKGARKRISPAFSLSSRSARVSTSAEESHPLNSPALLATILNDVFTFGIGLAFLNLHCFLACDAVQETYERAFIVVQMMSRATHFPFTFSPIAINWRMVTPRRNYSIHRPCKASHRCPRAERDRMSASDFWTSRRSGHSAMNG
jgi:hypothetical protein